MISGMPQLELPSERYRASYLAAEQEYVAAGSLWDGKAIHTEATYARMLEGLAAARPGLLELWLVEGDAYIGKIQIRPGGEPDHVGVSIRPSARQRGMAKLAVELARPHIIALGVDVITVVTSAANIPACALVAVYGGDMAEELPDGVFRFKVRVT
jgi:predicted acetyltransferase